VRASFNHTVNVTDKSMVAHVKRQPQPTHDTRPLAGLINVKIADRLRSVGIETAADWGKLTPKERRSIWGITLRAVETIDLAVQA
jgi:hypothetical protein